MDPMPLYRNGTNPLANLTRVPVSESPPTHDRLDLPTSFASPSALKYWIIDFGLSSMFNSRAKREHVRWDGGPNDFPECWQVDPTSGENQPTKLYDPFKADVFSIGKLIERYFLYVRYFQFILSYLILWPIFHLLVNSRANRNNLLSRFRRQYRSSSHSLRQ
jgi:hypothetical protein